MNPSESPLFEPVVDRESNITSYVLRERVAPLQQSFYYINDPSDNSGRYLWFYCAFPPSGSGAYGRTLGLIDFKNQQLHHFPETQFRAASPFVDSATAEVYWTSGRDIWRRSPHPDATVQHVNGLASNQTDGSKVEGYEVGGREVGRLATHLTRSADGKNFAIDASVGLQFWFGAMPIDGGDFELWHRLDRQYNHAQFNPCDSDLMLFAQEFHTDPITGGRFSVEDRLWTIRRGESPRPVLPQPTAVTHEWWDPDGKHVCCIRGRDQTNPGVWRINLATAHIENIWPGEHWHAHQDRTGQYMVSDRVLGQPFYRGCASQVQFFNRRTGREVHIAQNPAHRSYEGQQYHIDPHPRFVFNDTYVCYTTTIKNQVDLALVSCDELIAATS